MSLITIGAGDVGEYHGSQVPATARLYANKDFTTDDGVFIEHGSPAKPAFFQQFAASLEGVKIRIASGDAYCTTNSDSPDTTYTLCIYDDRGRKIATVLNRLRIPPDLDPTTWKTLEDYSRGRNLVYPPTYLDSNTILRMFDDIQNGAAVASDVQRGVTKLDVTPVDLADPIAVGLNSPLVGAIEMHLNGYASLGEAVYEIVDSGVEQASLIIKEHTLVTSDVNIPDHITLDIKGEGILDVATGVTVVIGCMKNPSSRKVFDGDGTIRFDLGAVEKMNVSWWVGATSGVDVTDAINRMFVTCIYNGGGRCYFPTGRWYSAGGHLLPTGTVIEGDGRYAAALSVAGGSLILLTNAEPSDDEIFLFKVTEGKSNFVFRDIRLDGEVSGGNSIGILCSGTFAADGSATSGDLRGENVTVTAFKDGLEVRSAFTPPNAWQMAQISFVGSTFSSNSNSSVKCNSVNSEFYFESTMFAAPAGAWVFDIANTGVFTAIGCEFAGQHAYVACGADGVPGVGMAEGVMRVTGAHAPINFIGCQDEAFRYFIYNTAGDFYSNFQLTGNLVQSIIYLGESCSVTSIGNIYRSKTFKDSLVSTPSVVTSVGDDVFNMDLCGNTFPTPVLTDFKGQSILSTQLNPNEREMTFRLPTRFLSPKLLDGNPTIPVLSAGHFTQVNDNKILLRMGRTTVDGSFDFYYDFIREYATGRLQLKGNQVYPFKGYDFNSDVYAEGAFRNGAIQLLDFGSHTIGIDPVLGNHFYFTLASDCTFAMDLLETSGALPDDVKRTKCDGQIITVEFIQNGAGGWLGTFGTGAGQFAFGTDIPAIVLSTAANKRDVAKFQYNKRTHRWLVIDFKKGFA